eukprot:g8298.t1
MLESANATEFVSRSEAVLKPLRFLPEKHRNDKVFKIETDDSGVDFSPPPSGVTADSGGRLRMEDSHSIFSFLLDITFHLSYTFDLLFPSMMKEECILALSEPQKPFTVCKSVNREVLHYFAVCDGHGGADAALHCQERMQENIRDAWNSISARTGDEEAAPSSDTERRREADQSLSSKTTQKFVEMLKLGFKKTDEEFLTNTSPLVGTTALVALVGRRTILIGYCGDSRAVLRRNGVAYALTIDHKPDRKDETARIKQAGGRVMHYNGARVMGLLAMSRAIGDRTLKPYISSEPDVCVLERTLADEVLILATDGLWDVVKHQEASNIATRCIKQSKDKGATADEATQIASAILAKTATTRGSRDNITVIVIDLNGYDKTIPTVSQP